jgi:hypothetical protein
VAVNINDLANPARMADSPIHWRPPQRLQKNLGPGAGGGTGIIAANDTNGEVVNVLGSGRIRIVAKVSAAGTLTAKWRLADNLTNQVTNQPATVALAAGVENILDILINPGYGYLEVSIVNGAGASTISYVDIFQTTEGN